MYRGASARESSGREFGTGVDMEFMGKPGGGEKLFGIYRGSSVESCSGGSVLGVSDELAGRRGMLIIPES